MSRYQRHIFVCTNQRPADNPRGCCASKGSEAVRDALKEALKKRGLARTVRAQNSGCLDACEHGVSMVVYPEGIWYGHVTVDDVPEVVDRTIVAGEVIQRLLIKDSRYSPQALQFPPLEGGGTEAP